MSESVAFSQMADPYAWVLRGLMDLGWEDISLSPESYPRIKGRGIDYSRILQPNSRFGLRLQTLAIDAENEWYRADGAYEFEIRLVNDPRLSFCILLRSDEMAFSTLFPWKMENPMFVVEDIHRAVVDTTISFIAKRKRRESISSIDLQEMLNHPMIPPPPLFISNMTMRLQRGLNLNTAIQEGLWVSQQTPEPIQSTSTPLPQPTFTKPTVASPTPTQQPSAQVPSSTVPQFTISAGQGRGQLMGQQGLASQSHSSAMVIVEPIAKWLLWVSYIGLLMGLLALVNGLFTLFMMSSGNVVRGSKDGLYLIVVVTSVGLGLFGMVGGFLAQRSNSDFRTLSKGTMKYFPLGFALLYPLSWFIGLPVGLYTLYILKKAPVQTALKTNT